jgi:arylformamidase
VSTPGTIDHEAEYNNRARVPEHPALIAGWATDAAACRASRPDAEIGVAYGPGARQTYDLFPAGSDAPLAIFVHGGYWQALDPSSFSHMARGVNARGVSMAVIGYTLCPETTIGGIVEEIRAACEALYRRFGRRPVVAGHSAGGHLAAMMLATDWAARGDGLPADLVPAAYAISGLFDLPPLVGTSINARLGLTLEEARRQSPLPAPPRVKGLSLDAVVGGDESGEYLRQSRTIVEAWGKAGVTTRLDERAGANHFTVIAPLADPASDMSARLAELAAAAGR